MAAAGIPFVFDPGQGLPMFNGDELRQFIQQATWVTVNDYEAGCCASARRDAGVPVPLAFAWRGRHAGAEAVSCGSKENALWCRYKRPTW